jgi:hypothetical protein
VALTVDTLFLEGRRREQRTRGDRDDGYKNMTALGFILDACRREEKPTSLAGLT